MTFDEWRDTHWKWGSSTDEAKALRAWNSAREDQDAEIKRINARWNDEILLSEKNRQFEEVRIRDKDAEIERLKGLIRKMGQAMEQENTDHGSYWNSLVEEAREATR
jgi:hypothetical protein